MTAGDQLAAAIVYSRPFRWVCVIFVLIDLDAFGRDVAEGDVGGMLIGLLAIGLLIVAWWRSWTGARSREARRP